MTLEERLKRAESGRQILYKGSDGSVIYKGDDGVALPAAPSDSLEDQRAVEELGEQRYAENGMRNWASEVDQFVSRAAKDSESRSGVWQDTSVFSDYQQKQSKTVSRLLDQSSTYKDFFNSRRNVYGDDKVDSILSALDSETKRLSGVTSMLDEEGKFRGQFLDQGEYDTYQRLSSAGLDDLKRWNDELSEEISGLKRQLRERTRTGLTSDPAATRERYAKIESTLAEKEQLRNRILTRYYQMDNEEKLAKLGQDSEAQSLYQTAGLDTASRSDRDSAIEALAGMGYDYNRLAQYQQTQKDAQRYAQQQEEIAAEAREHPGIANAVSILASPFQGLNYIDQAIRALTNGSPDDIENYVPLNPYNMGAVNYVSGVQGTTAEDIEKAFPNAELFGVNVPSFGYQTGSSILNSAYQVGLMGPASIISMGGAAAASEMQDIIARGGSNQQALMGGTAAGIAEMLFEKLSVENLVKPKSVTGWKSLVKETAKQAGIEASEETFTEIANIVSDAAIMGQDSRSAQAVREYMLQGMSREEAEKQVMLGNVKDVVLAGVGGALSGGVMGGVSGAFNLASGGVGQAQDDMRDVARRIQDYRDSSTGWRQELFSIWLGEQDSPLVQAARDVATQEIAAQRAQEPAQVPAPQPVQNITTEVRTAQEAAQGTAEAIQRAAAETSGQQRATQSAAPAAQTAQRTAAMENASALVKASEVFGENGQKAFAAAWDGQGDSAQYYAGFSTWYQAGLTGKAQNQVRGPYAGSVTEAQRIAAYDSGQRDAAASLAKEKAAAPYARMAGTEAGLYDAGDLDADMASRMDAAAKLLGARVYMVDSVADGRANGQYSGSDILIARDAENPEAQVFGHEVTHRVQELAPEAYRVFRQAALENSADSAVRAKIENYREQGLTIQYEAAMDDVAADYAGQLMEDGAALDQFIERHRTDRSLLEKLRDVFRGLWQKLTGAERRKAQTAEGKLSAALDEAAEQAKTLNQGKNSALDGEGGQGGEGEVKYSLKEFKDGRRFVEVDTDQAQFDGLSEREQGRLATKIIKERFMGKVIGLENRAYVNSRTAGEYGFPLNHLNADQHDAKMRASTELDNLMDAGTNFRTAPDGQDGHTHPDAAGDFQYFDTTFKVGGQYYTGVINIMQTAHGLVLKDITKIRNITQDISGSYGDKPQATFLRDTSMDSVPQSGGESKPQYSLKGATITKTYNQLLRENDALRERVDYWRGQTRQTKEVTVDKKAVNAAAKDIVKEYGAQLDAGELSGRLQALYDHMARTWYDKGETEGSDVWKGAEEIAKDIAGSAVKEFSLAEEFPGLKEKLRDTPITIGHEYDNDLHNENFRRDYRGKLKLSSQGPTNVDAVYAELSESYPGLFPEDITHPADQMEQIMDVVDSLSSVERQDRFSGQMDAAVMGITNEIVDKFLGLDLTEGTFADRQAAKLDKLRADKNMKLEELRTENKQAVRDAIAKERKIREKQIKAIKDRYAQSRENAAGRRADSKARDRLLHIAKRLQNKKLPEVNRTLLNEYIGDLDTTAKSMTGKTLAKLTDLRDWYQEQKSNNKDFIADPKIEHDLERLSKRQIADLSAQEVTDLTQVLLNIENEIRTQRKLIDSQERRDVYAAGEAAIRDIEASAGSKPTGLFGFLDKNIVTETLSPLRQVRRMTGYVKDSPLTKVTQELADGKRAMFDYQMKAEKQFEKYTNDKGFAKSFAGPKAKGIQIQGIGKDGPTTVTITPAMRASLYLHSLNDQNLKHIRDGGITVPDWKLYQKGQIAEAYARGTTIRLTPSQVRSITANMTQKERAFALAAHRYFNVTSKEAVNAVSEKLKGYSLAQVENYFPINTDSSFTRADFESVKRDGSIEGMGFLKERINAANPILLRDMGDVLDQSIRMHSKYAGLAVPVRNFYKLWNVTTGQWVDGDTAMDYNGDEGGDSYGQTDGLEETAGYNRRGAASGGLYADTGTSGTDTAGPGRIAAWAEGAQVQDPGEPAKQAVKTVRGYGVQAVVIRDAAIKARNPSTLAVTEGGVVYLSDALTEQDTSVGHHETVHAVKQRGSAAYDSFLDDVGGKLDLRSARAREVIDVVTNSRFQEQDFMDLTPEQQRTVFDELNALVWGCYKADAQNARAQFEDVFTDYGGYITALGGVMEAEKAKSSRRFKYEDSVKSAVKSKWGETGYSYIEKMMSDLQNGNGPTKAWAKAMNKLRSNYAGAVLTLNGSVAMKQAASYPTAAAVLGWGPLAKAMKSFGKVDLDLIAKYTPLQWYRSKGFSTQELGDMRSANRQLPKVLNWVQGVDLITTRKLWKASEYYVQAHNKDLNRGSDAYYKAVADIYNQVIEETQPNYTTMQRPQLLRRNDSLLANLQMFKTQPFQNFNILYDAAGEFTAARRRGDKAEIKQARAKVGRAVTSQLAQLAVFAGMGMAWAVFRGKKKKYEDEEGELTLQSAMSALGKDMAGGALAGIPFGSDAWELLSSKMFGDSYYGMDAVTVQALSDTIQSLGGMEELIEGTIRSASAGEKIDWRSAGIKMDGYIDDISKAAGVPWENVANLFQAIYRQVAVQSLGELQGEYAAMKITVDPKKKSGDYYDLLYKALERGDLDSYFTIREELPELLGKDNSDIDGAMKSRYKDKLEKDAAYSLSQRAYDLLGILPKLDDTKKEAAFSPDDLDNKTYQSFQEQRADRWRESAAKLDGNSLYGKLSNAEKDKAMDYAWEYAHQTALAEASGGKYKPSSEWVLDAQKAEKNGVQPWEYALNKAAYNTDAAYSALESGDLGEYKTLRGKYMDVLGKEGTSVDAAMRRDYEDRLEENPNYTLNQAAMDLIGIHPSGSSDSGDSFGADDLGRAAYDAYTIQRSEVYRETVDGLKDLPSYKDMDQATIDTFVTSAYTMAHQTALADNSGGQYTPSYKWVRNSQIAQDEYDIDAGEFLLWHTATSMTSSDRDENNKEIKGRKKSDKLRNWLSQEDLTYEQKAFLWGTEYTSEW